MDGGRFTILLVLIFALGGGSLYYSYTQVDLLKAQIATVNARIDPVQTNAVNAGKLANGAKVAADAAAASAAKANDAVNQLNTTVAAIQTKPAPAAAPAKKK
jgi:hypothetical protein